MPDYRVFAVENRLPHKLYGINLERDREEVAFLPGFTFAFGKGHEGWNIPDCSDDNWWNSNRMIITPNLSTGWMSLFKDGSQIYYSLGLFKDKKPIPLNPNNPPQPSGKVKLTLHADGTPLIEAYTPQLELTTWYNAWNQKGLDYLTQKKVPLNYATRYNIAFGDLVAADGGYTIKMMRLADQVKEQILAQAPGAVVYAGLKGGIPAAVQDNKAHQNRSTRKIADWLIANGYRGISIDVEVHPDIHGSKMTYVPEFVNQLGVSFRAAGLGIAVSVPWPGLGPTKLYGNNAVQAFNDNVDAVELQDYSGRPKGTPNNASTWTWAGVKAAILMGGVRTENTSPKSSDPQTSLDDVKDWTQYAMGNGLRGMFSWRLDNDHGMHGTMEDADPRFLGARAAYKAAMDWGVKFKGRPAVFPTNPAGDLKSISVLSTSGRLAQLWDTNIGYTAFWNFAFPADAAGHGYLRFQGSPAVVPTDPANNKMFVYGVTTDGQVVEMCHTDRWTLDFPGDPRFKLNLQNAVAVFPKDAQQNLKCIYGIDTDGRLVLVDNTYNDRWENSAPIGNPHPLQGIPAGFATGDSIYPYESIYAVTRDGRLMQVYRKRPENSWTYDFPAERAGLDKDKYHFQSGVAVFPTDAENNKKAIYAITTDGELVCLYDTDVWNPFFPLHGASWAPPLQGIPGAFPRRSGTKWHADIFAITREGKLVWVLPNPGAGHWNCNDYSPSGVQLQGNPAVFQRPNAYPSAYTITTDDRLAQYRYDDQKYQTDFPAEEV